MERGPVGKPRQSWECNIKVDLLDTRLIDLVQDRCSWQDLVNAVMKLRVPQHARIFLIS
jgi:hypothetical protein